MARLKILADHNIPYVREAFGTLGEVELFSGREIPVDKLRRTDVLLIRSVSRVTGELLEGTPVKMVCTATTGTDHVDVEALQKMGIAFANAAGSNANSVAEYVAAVLLELAVHFGFSLEEKVLGIVGVGRIGSLVKNIALGLGMRVLLNDPPLAEATGDPAFLPLDALMEADIVTLHVPLTRGGRHPTYHLFGAERLARLRPEAVLVNTSRGAVVDNQALADALARGKLRAAVLDVWENEPVPSAGLMRRVWIATPHIAGHSFDGKVKGTLMIYRAVCHYLGIAPTWRPESVLPPPEVPRIRVEKISGRWEEDLLHIVRQVYNVWRDDRAMRKIAALPPDQRGRYFDSLRNHYPVRWEFYNTTLVLSGPAAALADRARVLGFQTEN